MRLRELFAILLVMRTAPLPVSKVQLPGIRVTLSETTLDDVAKVLGNTAIAHAGDAGDSRRQMCFLLSGAEQARLYLEAGEMTGGERVEQVEVITAGAATAAEDTVIANDCPRLTASGTSVRTDRGIRLGSLRKDVDRLLRQHGRDSAGVAIYEASEVRRFGEHQAVASASIRIRYAHNRVVAFAAAANITD